MDSQLGQTVNNYGLLGGDRLNMGQGALQQTGNPLDLAIEGEGFFQVQTPQRAALHARWRLSSHAERATGDSGGRSGALGDRPADSRSSGRGVGGRGWSALGGWRRGGHGGRLHLSRRHAADPGGSQPLSSRRRRSQPCSRQNAAVHQGAIESANQDVIQGTLDLIVMQREAEMMQKALTVFHTEFNKIASEDLPKV